MQRYILISLILQFILTTSFGNELSDLQERQLLHLRVESINRQAGTFFVADFANGITKHLSGRFSNDVRSDFRSQALQFLDESKVLFGFADLNSDFIVTKETVDQFGMHHLTLQQIYQSVPVLHHQLKIHTDVNGSLSAVSNNYFSGISISITPAISDPQALDIARMDIGNSNAGYKAVELIIYIDKNEPRLAYQLDLAASMAKAKTYIIDANSGEILKTFSLIHEQATYGTGVNLLGESVDSLNIYFGSGNGWDDVQDFIDNVNANWDYQDYTPVTGNYNLVDESDTTQGRIFTLTASNSAFFEIDFVLSATDTFTSDIDTLSHFSGVSAHDYHRKTVDYYYSRHGRVGWLSPGYRVIALVDYGPNDQISQFNAFYSGFYGSVNYGIGGGNTRPFCAAIDVCAHELTHGVTSYSSGLIYENMPGALNESMSDVFGYLVEAEYQNGGDWLMGEDLYLTGGFIRDMQHPPNGGDPDHMANASFSDDPSSSNDYGGVHSNSGLPNKVFYLLVEGDMHYGIEVPPFDLIIDLSRAIAANIWYIWNTQYLTATDDFYTGREKMLQVCGSLYPGNQDYYASIQKAWGAVGVQPAAFVTLSEHYLVPGSGEITIQSTFQYSYTGFDVVAEIVSLTDLSVDTTTLFDDGAHDDSLAADNIWGGSWLVGSEEDIYNVNIFAYDANTGLTDLYFDLAHFTTAGPLVFDTLTFLMPASGEPVPGEQVITQIHVQNMGSSLALPAISAQVLPLDTLVSVIGASNVFFGDILPGQTVPQYNYFAFTITPEFPAQTELQFELALFSESEQYWKDTLTLQIHGTVSTAQNPVLPDEYALYQNYPNPFNPETVISYDLPKRSQVAVDIYNLRGQMVRSLKNQVEDPGIKSIRWDGKDFSGQVVGAGVYIYRVRAGEYTQTRKMLLLK